MNRLFKLLLVFALTTISYGAFAQMNVALNSIHKYKMGEDIATSKYLWRVTKKDGSEAVKGTDYEFVTSYTEFGTDGSIPLAINDVQMLDHQLAVIGKNVVYVKWLIAGETYNVTARVFDNATGCSDDVFNVFTTPDIIVGNNDFVATLSCDVRRNVDTNKDGVINDSDTPVSCAIRDGANKTQVSFTLEVTGNRETTDAAKEADAQWRYKYKYFFGDSEPADWNTVSNESAFVLNADDADGSITVEEIIPTGDGEYQVWVLITEIYDGYGLAPNNTSVLKVKAIINKIPTKQVITAD